MNINFPERGEIRYSGEEPYRLHFISAPLNASFPLKSEAKIGQIYEIKDDAGTTLSYRLDSVYVSPDRTHLRGTGELVGVTHEPLDMIPAPEHEQKLSTAIDQAFEAGKQMAEQEAAEREAEELAALYQNLHAPSVVHVRFADGSTVSHPGIIAIADTDGVLTLAASNGNGIGVHSSWRSYEIEDQPEKSHTAGDTADTKRSIYDEIPFVPLESEGPSPGATVVNTLNVTECSCDACKRKKTPPEERSWLGKAFDDLIRAADEPQVRDDARVFRYGPIGGKI